MTETRVEVPASTRKTAAAMSMRIIAVAVVFACLSYASLVFITLVSSVVIAFVLDPPVQLMERIRIPRWLGSLVVVLLMLAGVYLLGYMFYGRIEAFISELPKYADRIRLIIAHLRLFAKHIQQGTSHLMVASQGQSHATVLLQRTSPWFEYLMRGIGPVYGFTVTILFIPFLVFFMLASKNQLRVTTLNLFPLERRQQVEDVIQDISYMVRQYILGNFLVGIIATALIAIVFYAIGLPSALIMAGLTGFIGLIPYIGLALGMLFPLALAFVNNAPGSHLIAIIVSVALVHLLVVDFLTPKLVGSRLKLNAVSVTIAVMVWGWLWGGAGLVLALPIMACLKAVCDNVESLKPFGAWMGER